MRLLLRGTERFVPFGEQNLLQIKHPQKRVVSSTPAPASLNVLPETNDVREREQSHRSPPPNSQRTAVKLLMGAGAPTLRVPCASRPRNYAAFTSPFLVLFVHARKSTRNKCRKIYPVECYVRRLIPHMDRFGHFTVHFGLCIPT